MNFSAALFKVSGLWSALNSLYFTVCYMRSSWVFFPACLKKTSVFSHCCALMSLRLSNASLVEVKTVAPFIIGKAEIKNMHESNHLLNVIITRILFGKEVGENND